MLKVINFVILIPQTLINNSVYFCNFKQNKGGGEKKAKKKKKITGKQEKETVNSFADAAEWCCCPRKQTPNNK